MSNFNHEEVWESQVDISGSTHSKMFRGSLESKCTSQWQSHISETKNPNSSNKLRNYAEFKSEYKFEHYILLVVR
jgi:hypothetical protein